MITHEDRLLAILEKIGRAGDVSAAVAAVEDATSNADHTETVGSAAEPPLDPPPPKGVGSESPAPITSKNLFVHHDTHPVVFDVALLARYELSWIVWDAQTLWKEIKEDFRVPSISDHTCAKIQALRTLHINEWFWTKWEVFCWVTQALNNNIPDFHVIQKPSIAQLFSAVSTADMVRSGENFSAEVRGWMAACMVDEGVYYAPRPIAFCQDSIVQLLRDLQVEDPESWVKSVKERHKYVMSLSEDQWRAATATTPILKETAPDIQAAKLKVAEDYLTLRMGQLKDQLRLLK